MAVNPYTLNTLYNYGILDYAPYELCNNGVNVSAMNGIQNPYLNTAMQGSLYQQYGNQADSFTRKIGTQSNTGINAFGLEGIGGQGNAGMNAFGVEGIGSQAPSQVNAWGGFSDAGKNISNGVAGTASFIDRIPSPVKGIAAAALMIGSVALIFRGKKKPPAENSGFLSKLNPVNWFKKSKI